MKPMKQLVLFITALTLSSITVFAQNLIADYHFDGNLIDKSSSQNHLNPFGSGNLISYSEGCTNSSGDSSIVFSNGHGLVSDSAVNNISWIGTAVSFWTKGSSSGKVIQGAYSGLGITLNGSGNVEAFFDGTSTGQLPSTNNTDLADTLWHHIVAQNNGDTTFIYIDALLDTLQPETLFTMTGPKTNAKYYIGITNLQLLNLTGNIDGLKVYDDALTQSQITTLYNKGIVTSVRIDIQSSDRISWYPNPTNGYLTFDHQDNIYVDEVEIKSINGQVVLSKMVNSNTIDIHALPSGIYLISLKYQNRTVSNQKFIKE